MKQLFFLPLLSVGTMLATSDALPNENKIEPAHYLSLNNEAENEGSQAESGTCKMPAAVFKAQEFCRAELKDFDFDAHFSVVGATVYFSGANFKIPEKGTINSSSLKPIRSLMDRCVPGTIIIFDDVKVIGPDNKQRTIPGLSIILI